MVCGNVCARNQATNKMTVITHHLQKAISQQYDITMFSMLVELYIHADTKYKVAFSKHQYNVDILIYTISKFVKQIN